VNTIWWSDDGRRILSGADDRQLIITDPFTDTVVNTIATSHRGNIFAARFIPLSNDTKVSQSGLFDM
jgi:hypothetical protein